MTAEWYEGMFCGEGMFWGEGMLWSEENILCLDSGNYMTIHICQDYQNCIPKKAKFFSIQYSSKLKFLSFPNFWKDRIYFLRPQLNNMKEAEKNI